MIVTRNCLQEFIDIKDISTQDLCKTFNAIGLEVDSVERLSIPKKVVVGKVIDKIKHPDADKLNICQVDLGDEVTQIVCGAKNVDIDQFVPVATVGCDLGAGFKIKKAKLRGEASNGMICSSSELGLPKLNDGILVLDNSIGELILGKELCEYPLLNDDIIEIELTANRGDCLSINGVARELAAFYNIPLKKFEKDVNYNNISIGQILEISSKDNIDTSLVYKAIDVSNFKVNLIQKVRLGIIDKYEDEHHIKNILSYTTHFTGVILNAYSKEQAKKENDLYTLSLKKDENGFDSVYGNEKLSTLCVTQDSINEKEDQYLIEASYINPDTLCKKVFETKVKTQDVYYKTSRGSEPDIEFGMNYFTTLVSKNGASVYKGYKSFENEQEKIVLDINIDKINAIIGQKVEKNKCEQILKNLQFEVKNENTNTLIVKIPHFRHDIKNIADVTEEIVRIIGIDNIKAKPLKIDEVNRVNKTSNDLVKKNKLRFKAIEHGFYETLTYVFSSKENLEKYGFKTVKEELDILNPIVKELNTYRTTILLNLVEACSMNFKHGTKSSAFFEIGTVFDENRVESKKISFIQTGAAQLEDVQNAGKPQNIDFFTFSKKILNTIGKFDLETMENQDNAFIHPYQSANILVDGKIIGFISKLHPSVASDYGLNDTFIAEIDFDSIQNDTVKTQTYSKFQASKKDLSIIVPKNLEYKNIKQTINSLEDKRIKQFNLIDIYSDESLGENESLTIRFVLQDDDKTLEEDEITNTMNNILEILDEKLGIKLR